MNIAKPKSAGTIADIKANTNIGKVHGGYFSSSENISEFIRIGIKPIIEELKDKVTLVDLGGGEGLLILAVQEYLKSKGKEVKSYVVDANPNYLKIANSKGLNIIESNIQDLDFNGADLVIMRAVLHYNEEKYQKQILSKAYETLNNKGLIIIQNSSGNEENCKMRSEIINLESLDRGSSEEKYRWISSKECIRLLKNSGFNNCKVMGEAPPCSWTLSEQWERANPNGKNKSDREIFMRESKEIIEKYVKKHGAEYLGIERQNDDYVINYQYPILMGRKE